MQTSPYTPDPQHARLLRLIGDWQGTAKTWLDPSPSAPPVSAPWEGAITELLGGRFVQFDYRSSVNDTPIAGRLLIAFESSEGLFRTTWIDSFHTGTAVLVSVGKPGDADVDVLGAYFIAEGVPPWGWRTRIDDSRDGELVIRMYNVKPEGEEKIGVEIALKRPA